MKWMQSCSYSSIWFLFPSFQVFIVMKYISYIFISFYSWALKLHINCASLESHCYYFTQFKSSDKMLALKCWIIFNHISGSLKTFSMRNEEINLCYVSVEHAKKTFLCLCFMCLSLKNRADIYHCFVLPQFDLKEGQIYYCGIHVLPLWNPRFTTVEATLSQPFRW